MKIVNVGNAAEMGHFAGEFVAALAPGGSVATVVALSGELGAGKTTFAQAVARSLGVEETVNSPTFVIEKIYPVKSLRDHVAGPVKPGSHGAGALQNSPPAGGWQRLVHIDAYRLKSAVELYALRWDDLVADPANLIIIEWPENVPDAIPKGAHRITIEIGEGEARTIHYDD